MNDYWHIPRASLASSSTASIASSSHRSNKSNLTPPTVAQSSLQAQARQHKERESVGGKTATTTAANLVAHGGSRQTRVGHAKRVSNARRNSELSATSAATTAAAAAAVLAAASASATAAAAAAAKRGSRSSQGSSGSSNNSTRSAASGSLLLTAANLERFAEIHKKQQQQKPLQHDKLYVEYEHDGGGTSTTYATNLTQALQHQQHQQQQQQSGSNTSTNNDAIITMDPNLDFVKTKDLDTVSIASSMHFTMVNGEGGPPKKPKRGLCDRGRQVTVLIVSMSTIFLLLILGMVYALEMRAREMPQS